jgi:site-specific recombinase XerD|tara:strand:- start:415 stop:1548 length:1134 start_codon:yes stop_codon:yes gene_type:complete
MRLFFATDSFKIDHQPYPGFPILAHDDMTTFREGFKFLSYRLLKRGRVLSKNSWVTYGRDLYDFFPFLDANDLDWRDVGERFDTSVLSTYRDVCLTEYKLAPSTVNRRLGLAIKFYQYAARQGWVSRLPYDIEEIRVQHDRSFLAHTDRTGGVRATADVLLATKKTRIKLLNTEQVGMLLNAIEDAHLKLMIRLFLTTGIRKEELLTFPESFVINPQKYSVKSHYVVNLTPQKMAVKGSHERSIHIPKSLMEDLWQYTIHERSARSKLGSEDFPQLFLNDKGRPYSTISNTINTRLKKLGLPFEVYPHIFRHTYATHTLKSLMERNDLKFNPLMYVRDRLGHSSITTTEKYLHFIDDIADGVMNDYQREIDNLVEAA